MIFYFSATGNSKYAAEKIREEFGGDMVDISYATKHSRYEYAVKDDEKVFIVFPVYFFGTPKYVDAFIEHLNFTGGTPQICGIATYGGNAGSADRMFRKCFAAKDMEVDGFYTVKMVDNYVLMYKMVLPEEQVMIQHRADHTIREIIDNVKFLYRVSYKSGIFMNMFAKTANSYYRKHCGTKKFTAGENCIGCGLCQTVCPAIAIDMDDGGRPVWVKEQCEHCMACINRCPVAAIEYGSKTRGRGRYVNPEVK